ncbi:MAG: thiamine phosphate synthase [Lachnospiraceae bacterium]|nr:thiamine phosphate synthase [Lachnospiraceae bacterium]
MKVERAQLLVYGITDERYLKGRTLEECVEQALKGGATVIQLRDKHADEETLLKEAESLQAVCERFQAPLIINDDIELALRVGAAGAHVGQDDMAVSEARAKLGADRILGVTAHNVAEALAAEQQGADYLGCGAMFTTGTKDDAVPMTREEFREICNAVSIPVVAIGGITAENAPQLQGIGAAGLSVSGGLFAEEDIEAAAGKLRAAAELL